MQENMRGEAAETSFKLNSIEFNYRPGSFASHLSCLQAFEALEASKRDLAELRDLREGFGAHKHAP